MATRTPSKKTVRKSVRTASVTTASATPAEPLLAKPGKARKDGKLAIDLALQGGGAHGAFTWGVLDRLLDEKDIDIEGVSGTSAGAMNGAMLVYGSLRGGRKGAQELLTEFWESVAQIGALYAPFKSAISSFEHTFNLSALDPFQLLGQTFSPYQTNPFNLNPLRDLLVKLLDIQAIQNSDHMRLFVTATNVETGQGRVFSCEQLTIDALMASACLPFMYQAVEIDGVPYWDGGYAGNPVIWPLIYNTDANDILLVQINPLVRKGTPTKMEEIVNRVNEITFNASLVAEMRAIQFVGRLLKEQKVDHNSYKNILMHRINMQDVASDVDASSKENTDLGFLRMLRDRGREAATQWLKAHKGDIGVRDSIDVHKTFLAKKPSSAAEG